MAASFLVAFAACAQTGPSPGANEGEPAGDEGRGDVERGLAGPSGPSGPSATQTATPDTEANAGADAPQVEEPDARAQGPGRGVDLVVLADGELLGSQRRTLDRFAATMRKEGVAVREVVSVAAARREELGAWIDTPRADARANLGSRVALADAAAVLAFRVRPPVRRVAKGHEGIVLLVRGEQPQRMRMQIDGAGGGLEVEDARLFAGLLADVPGVEQAATGENGGAQ